jgi:hypothetical protein
MQYVEFIVTRPTTGASFPGAKVTVYLAGTTTLATLYNASGGGVSNPATADAYGLVGFAASNGSYDFSAASADGSYVVPTVHRQQFYDLSGLDAQATLAQSAAAAAAASAATATTVAQIAATSAAAQTISTFNAGPLNPSSSAYSAAAWLEILKTLSPGNYVDALLGIDSRSLGTLLAPIKTTARANALASPTLLTAFLLRGQRHATRLGDYVSIATNIIDYGRDTLGPLIDLRQDLSANTWTLLSGSTTTWEITATLGSALNAGGIDTANGSKFVLYQDTTGNDPTPAGKYLNWITNNANVSANDTAIKASSGSFGINVVGSTIGDIRNDTSGATSVRLVVHLLDNSNPNGQALRLMDGAVYTFSGGDHGHVRYIGGGQKDNISFGEVFGSGGDGPIPTFQSFIGYDLACHGGVGVRNHVGECRLIGKPIVGESAAVGGRTSGGGLHLFTPIYRPNRSVYCGSVWLENFSISAIYGHTAGTRGYGGRFDLYNGGYINNCGDIYGAGGSSVAGKGFFESGAFLSGKITAENMTNGYTLDDTTPFQAIGPVGNNSTWKAKGPSSSNFITLYGWHSNILIANQNIDASAVNGSAPDNAFRVLVRLSTTGTDPTNTALRNTVELRNVQDVTKITTAGGKMGVYVAETDSARNFDFNMIISQGTTLGDMWRFSSFNTYPASFADDGSDTTIGFGGKTRAQFRAAMAAAGKPCTMSNRVRMVDYTGAIVDERA